MFKPIAGRSQKIYLVTSNDLKGNGTIEYEGILGEGITIVFQ